MDKTLRQVHQPRRDAGRNLPLLARPPRLRDIRGDLGEEPGCYREYYRLKGIVPDEEGSARSLTRIQRTTS